MRILIVDDHPERAAHIAAALPDHEVAIERDAIIALARVHNAQHGYLRFDVVVSAVEMPGMSGLDLCVGVRGHDNPPVFIAIAGARSDRTAAASFDGVLFDPLDGAQVRTLVARGVAHRRAAATQRIRLPVV